MPKILLVLISALGIIGLTFYFRNNSKPNFIGETFEQDLDEGEADMNPHALSIASLKSGDYPGSGIVVEQTLTAGSNYLRHIVSYKSEGLKIYALLTVPQGKAPTNGWPAIVFNHGFIQPAQYRTDGKYVAYVDGFARNGYVVIKSDFRGHGNSEGEAVGGYGSNGYTIDVLNAVSAIKKYPNVDPNRIGMWGHSMGGHLTLRAMVTSQDVKAGVIWGGVVASYEDLLTNWRRNRPSPSPTGARRWRQQLTEQFGTHEQNPTFWNSISATSYLSDISGPIQLHHGTSDPSVPVEFSEKLASQLKSVGKEVELFTYDGDDHNLSANFNTAIERSVEFFDKYLK